MLSHGVTTPLAHGSRNDFVWSIAADEVGGGVRTALDTASDARTGLTALSATGVNLAEIGVPVVTSTGLYNATTGELEHRLERGKSRMTSRSGWRSHRRRRLVAWAG